MESNIVTTISQHEQMALSYVNHIASALQEYQTGVPVLSRQSPQLYFLDLAWAGLLGTPAYNNLPNVDRTRIELQWVAETTNQPATANRQTAAPVGTRNNPC